MAKSNLSNKEQVDEYLSGLEPAVAETLSYIRKMILGLSSSIAEHIKWNSPSFYYTEEMAAFDPKEYKRDLLVCNVHRGKILLVFPTGAKVADHVKGKNYPDGRKIVALDDLADLKAKEKAILSIASDWLGMID